MRHATPLKTEAGEWGKCIDKPSTRGSTSRRGEIQRVAEASHEFVRDVTPAQTMGEVFELYRTEIRRKGGSSQPTIESALDCWLMPALGKLKPSECTPPRLFAVRVAMESVHRAPLTIRKVLSFVRSACTYACSIGALPDNPIILRGILPPKRHRQGFDAAREVLSIDALERIASCARIPFRERVLYVVACLTGLREGELLELRWSDIDREHPDGAVLRVTRQWVSKPRPGKVGPPKAGGPRAIPLRQDVLEALDWWRLFGWPHIGRRHARDDDLVFPRRYRQRIRRLDDGTLLEGFKRHLGWLGLGPRRIHATRHTFLALLLEAGAPLDLAKRFSHPKPNARPVDHYAHHSPKTLRDAIERIPIRLRFATSQLEFDF